jgi:hypothetical protein
MHFHIGFAEFVVWVCYFVIFKAFVQVLHLWLRRNGSKTGAGVTGLLA